MKKSDFFFFCCTNQNWMVYNNLIYTERWPPKANYDMLSNEEKSSVHAKLPLFRNESTQNAPRNHLDFMCWMHSIDTYLCCIKYLFQAYMNDNFHYVVVFHFHVKFRLFCYFCCYSFFILYSKIKYLRLAIISRDETNKKKTLFN